MPQIKVPSKVSMIETKQIAQEKIGIKRDQQMLHLNENNVTEYGYNRLHMNKTTHPRFRLPRVLTKEIFFSIEKPIEAHLQNIEEWREGIISEFLSKWISQEHEQSCIRVIFKKFVLSLEQQSVKSMTHSTTWRKQQSNSDKQFISTKKVFYLGVLNEQDKVGVG